MFYLSCDFSLYNLYKMVNVKFETQRQTIKYYWNIGIRLAKQIYEITSISLYTVEYNFKKLREIGDIA